MKYIVEVNAKWLVSIEAESVLNAEHKLLEYNGVWGAMAYDRAMMKTDTFAGAVQGCEMVSMSELIEMINAAMDAKAEAVKAEIEAADANDELKKLEQMLAEAKKKAHEAAMAKAEAMGKYNKAVELLGEERR